MKPNKITKIESPEVTLKSLLEIGASVPRTYKVKGTDYTPFVEENIRIRSDIAFSPRNPGVDVILKDGKRQDRYLMEDIEISSPLELLCRLRVAMSKKALTKECLIELLDYMVLNYNKFLESKIKEFDTCCEIWEDFRYPAADFNELGSTSSEHWNLLREEQESPKKNKKENLDCWRDLYDEYGFLGKSS